MLFKSRPMTNYKNMNKLLYFLDVKNIPKTKWSNIIGWKMSSSMHDLVVNTTKTMVDGVSHFPFL